MCAQSSFPAERVPAQPEAICEACPAALILPGPDGLAASRLPRQPTSGPVVMRDGAGR